MKSKKEQGLYKIKEAEKLVPFSSNTLRRKIKSKEIPVIVSGNVYFITKSVIAKINTKYHSKAKKRYYVWHKINKNLLTPKEYLIAEMRYKTGMTFEDIGRQFKVSKQRAKQIVDKINIKIGGDK